MTVREADRYAFMREIESQKTSIVEASQAMGISYRHARRLWSCYQKEGPKGLIPKSKGKPRNNQLPQGIKKRAIALIKENYADYGPTLVAEKLEEWIEKEGPDVYLEFERRGNLPSQKSQIQKAE